MLVKKLFESEKGRGSFLEVLPKEVTLNLNYDFKNVHGDETMFNEVRQVPFKPNRKELEIINYTPKGLKSWEIGLYEILNKQVQGMKFDKVSASSGYDTRVLCLILKELGIKTTFYEWGEEADYFNRVMDYFGFERKVTPLDYSLDFVNGYKKFSMPVGYPINHFYFLDGEILTGFGQNEISMFQDVKKFYNYEYHLALNSFNLQGNWHFPFYCKEFIKERMRLPIKGDVSESIIKKVSPKLLEIPRYSATKLKNRGLRLIDEFTFRQAVKDFKNSRIGFIDVNPTREINYSTWWGWYNTASLIEGLNICVKSGKS
jgi:hypothetical protein